MEESKWKMRSEDLIPFTGPLDYFFRNRVSEEEAKNRSLGENLEVIANSTMVMMYHYIGSSTTVSIIYHYLQNNQ